MTDFYTSRVAKNVRSLRSELGWSARKLSARTNGVISRNGIANLENGRRESITLAEVEALALALDVPEAQLMNLESTGCSECISKDRTFKRIAELAELEQS